MTKHKNDAENGDDDVISFTPLAGFDIRKAAGDLARLMEETGHPLVIHLSRIAAEFEPGCTREEIIDGYNEALRAAMGGTPANCDMEKKD